MNVKTKGYVYIGYDASRKGFKIGKSTNPEKREEEIRRMNPSFELLAFGFTDNYSDVEKKLHEKYSKKRIIGEWFSLSPNEISELLIGKLSPEEIEEITGIEL